MLHLAIVVTAAPAAYLLTPADMRRVFDRLPFAWRIDQRWLGRGEAWEAQILVPGPDQAAEAMGTARDALAGRAVDINLVPAGRHRRKQLLVADMESTIIEQEMIDELATVAHVRHRIAPITERTMRGELDFVASLTQRVALLAHLDAALLETLFEERVSFMPGALTLVRTMKRHGATAALVSGGFSQFTAQVAERLGFDHHQGNTVEIAHGLLTGRLRAPILGPEAKLAALCRMAAEKSLACSDTLAVGDGANDIPMLTGAGLGVAFRAKPKVRDSLAALRTGAVVDHGDLTALLYLQGYRREEFAQY